MAKTRSTNERRRGGPLWKLAVLGAVVFAGAASLWSQEVIEAQKLPLARPQPPPLLSRGEVQRGLGERFVAMQRRGQAYMLRRQAEAARNHRVPEPPPGANVPARPDAPEGEIVRQKLEVSR